MTGDILAECGSSVVT